MRGGLGRTLLTAFLLLAIVPLSAISWYATMRERQDIQREVTAKLSSVAALMETQVRQWAEHRAAALALLAALPNTRENINTLFTATSADSEHGSAVHSAAAREALRAQLRPLLEQDPAFRRLAVLDGEGRVLVSTDPQSEGSPAEQALEAESISEQPTDLRFITLDPAADVGLMIVQRIAGLGDGETALLAGWLNLSELAADLQAADEPGQPGEIYLVDARGMALPHGQTIDSPGIEAALSGQNTEGLQENYAGVPVIGVYRWIPELGLALVAEQEQEKAFATADTVTAAVVGATLIVALATAVIAAIVTRQITRPVVRLTESALSIAAGDLKQRVPVTSQDEIGILAYVFNRMTAELKTLYDNLESKVVERTALLQKANYQIQRRAIQMQASLEVGQAVTSILDPDQLLKQVVQVVRNHFVYSYVAVYTADEDEAHLLLRACDGEPDPFHGQRVSSELSAPVGRAFRERAPVVESHPISVKIGPPASYTRSEAALPLCLGEHTLGVLDIQSTDEEGFDQDDVFALQNVASQITIALENARAYAVELEAVKQLRELDRSKRRFLTNMSHELRTPLTNIIGFSRLMLKGIEGPLTEQQRSDLQIIYQDSQHLLGLIDDLLDISQIEAGLMELEFQKVDVTELIHSVMATASALVHDKDVELRQEVAPDLPAVRADTTRVRQVLLQLLANAAKFTERGDITVRAWPADGEVMVSVSDTGLGIPPVDQERIFERFEQGTLENGRRPNGAGLGLALCKEFVEMHGGCIQVESEVGKGSTFTFSLPLSQARVGE
jgi:signal transduction histidine kinase/HAMP domain-containing protein